MDIERLFKSVITDLSLVHLKLEDELERIINSDDNLENKINNVKTILEKMAINVLSVSKFSMLTNNNYKQKEQDGKKEN